MPGEIVCQQQAEQNLWKPCRRPNRLNMKINFVKFMDKYGILELFENRLYLSTASIAFSECPQRVHIDHHELIV